MTNGDRIRQMTDEELADWFAPHMMCDICKKKDKPNGCGRNECKKYALAYMKQEVSEDAGHFHSIIYDVLAEEGRNKTCRK